MRKYDSRGGLDFKPIVSIIFLNSARVKKSRTTRYGMYTLDISALGK